MDAIQYRNLMAKDEFKNLGFADEVPGPKSAETKDEGKEGDSNAKDHKNELRW